MNRLALLVLALSLSACSSLKFWDSADNQSDSGEEGADKVAELQSFETQLALKKQWRQGIGKGRESFQAVLVPAVQADRLYAASREGRVTALNRESGKVLWRTSLDSVLSGGVGTGGGLVIVGDNDGTLIALDTDSGKERWRTSLSGEVLAAPGANSSVVVVQTQDAKLVGLAAETGNRLWQYETDVPVLSLRGTAAPVVTDTMVIAGFSSGKLVALEAGSGSVLWETRIAIPKGRTELERMIDVSSPILHNDIIYVTSYQGRVAAFSRGNGRELWNKTYSSHLSPSFGLGQIYVVDEEDIVQALRSNNGQILWTNDQLKRRNLTALQALAGVVALADSEGYLHLVSQADGSFMARTRVDGDGIAAFTVYGSTLYVLDNSGDLTAYSLEEG